MTISRMILISATATVLFHSLTGQIGKPVFVASFGRRPTQSYTRMLHETRNTASSITESSLSSSPSATVGVIDEAPPQPNEFKGTIHLYPYGSKIPDDIKQQYSRLKEIHFVRHAQGTHNVNREYRDIKNMDARLTGFGKDQCEKLAMRMKNSPISEPYQSIINASKVDGSLLIVTSPMTRCIQTTFLAFAPILESTECCSKVIVHESVRETVNFSCDRRRSMVEIQNDISDQFPNIVKHIPIDYTNYTLSNTDRIWDNYVNRVGDETVWEHHRESAEIHVVAERGRQFFHQFVYNRFENIIVVCSHAAFLRCVLNFGVDAQGIPYLPKQRLVQAPQVVENIPVVKYCGPDYESFSKQMRTDFDNCELRSMIVAFPK